MRNPQALQWLWAHGSLLVTKLSVDNALIRLDPSKEVVGIKSQVFKRASKRIEKGDKFAANASGHVRQQ